jgi:hypothetical protein
MHLLLGIRYHNVSFAVADNGDLLAELKYQLTRLDKVATIKFNYCDLTEKTGDDKPRQYIADLGADFNPHRVALAFPLPELQYINPPHNAVQLIYNGQPFLTKVKSTLRQDMYRASIQATICKQEGWSNYQFNQIDWAAHKYAFQCTWSSKQITYTKLVHKLLNTNEKNCKYYGKLDLCPCCHLNGETILHVFTCPAQEVLVFRRKQQTILWHHLSLMNTPDSLLADI